MKYVGYWPDGSLQLESDTPFDPVTLSHYSGLLTGKFPYQPDQTWSGNPALPGYLTIVPPPITVITRGAFRQRLTQTERIAFEMLTVRTDLLGALARDMKEELRGHEMVVLTDDRTIAGANALFQPFGVLADVRRVADLLADGTLAEAGIV